MRKAVSSNHKRKKSRSSAMTEKLLEGKINSLMLEVASLRTELVESGVLLDKDPEGEYNPKFVEEMLRISRKKGKDIPFTTAEDFLRRIRKGKKK
jgi:hypothetical protein